MNLFSPTQLVDQYAQSGANKTRLPWWKLMLLGILAGMMISFGGAVTNTAAHAITNVSAARIISGMLFPFGLCMVILTGAELFTGNCLICISVLDRRTSFWALLRNWGYVYFSNFIGGLIVAAGCAFFGQLNYSSGGLAVFTIKLAAQKCSMSFGPALVMGIFCNVLVCLGVLASLTAKDTAGRILGAYIPVSFFVICGFEHCVANMFFIPAGLFAMKVPAYAALAAKAGIDISSLTWGNFLLHNLLPVTIGNIIGGVVLGSCLWACYHKNESENSESTAKSTASDRAAA